MKEAIVRETFSKRQRERERKRKREFYVVWLCVSDPFAAYSANSSRPLGTSQSRPAPRPSREQVFTACVSVLLLFAHNIFKHIHL